MTVQVFSATRHITGRAVRRIIGRGALAAIVAGLGAISLSAYGADLEKGYSRAVTAPPRSAPAVRRPTAARPIDPPDPEPNRLLQGVALVDQLYDDLMRSSGCVLVSSEASIGGGCFEQSSSPQSSGRGQR
jgi:hypothetical protein